MEVIDSGSGGGTTTTTTPQVSQARTKIVEFCKQQVGKPYVWGAEGPDSFDCSGLVSAASNAAGLNLGRQTAATFYAKCTIITKDKLQAGDVGFKIREDSIYHIGVFIGDGKWIEAVDEAHGVMETEGKNFIAFGVLRGVDDGTIAIPAGSITVEPIYPDLTFPPGAQTKEYDQVPDEDPNATPKDNPIDGDIKDDVDKGIKTPMDEYTKRQQIFNPKDHKDAVKEVKGKPTNNKDPYPVDLKIVEMEAHLPRIKGQTDMAKLAIATEKRVVQLENIVSVLARSLFRMSSRIQINCVYYGGQSAFNKYNCIRCLHSDLVHDGGLMQIDQCLNCTRYEPIAGQIYDILDEDNQNLAVLLDTAQGAYMSMEEVIKLNRVEEMHTETPLADLHKDAQDPPKELNETWEEGFEMDWNETPVESQMANINSYQYGDGPLYDAEPIIAAGMRNAQASAAGLEPGSASGGNVPFDSSSALNPEYHGAVTSSDPWLQKVIDRAKGYAPGAAASAVDNMIKHGYKDYVVKYSLEAGVDPYLILSLITTESTGNPNSENKYYGGLMQISKADYSDWNNVEMNIKHGIDHYLGKCKAVKTNYPLFGMISYNSGQGAILGVSSWGAPALEGWPAIRDTEAKWCDVAPALRKQIDNYFVAHGYDTFEKVEYFVKIMYCYQHLKQVIKDKAIEFYNPPTPAGNTPFDKTYGMPLESGDLKDIYFTSDYGYRNIGDGQEFHSGIDLAPSQARYAKGDVYIVAAEAGTVIGAQKDSRSGNYVQIQHDNGYMTLYCHMQDNKTLVKTGDKVTRGQRIGVVGSTGRSTGPHLHFGVKTVSGKDNIDPKTMYQNLNTRLNKTLE